jgi:ADP-heptose:LPS heptosyltransferase
MKKVLIVSTSGMGDCLWGTPGIRALKKTFPEVEIDLIINLNWKPLFECNPHLNKIFEYREKWYSQPILGMQLYGRHYDAVFIFHANRNFKRMLPWLHSLPIWCHQNLDWVAESHRINFDSPIHGIQRRSIMLEKHGVKPDGGQMELFFNQNTLDKSQNFIETNGFRSGEFVYLNLGAAIESRQWMTDRFVELAKRILKTTSWNIILGGGPKDKVRSLAILSELDTPRAVEVCSQPIMVNASIISKAGLMVTSDTGPMHIGFAMKTPIVALFGTIPPIGSGPYEIPEILYKVIQVDREENGNTNDQNSGEFHFGSITIDMVWEQVEKMLPEDSKT